MRWLWYSFLTVLSLGLFGLIIGVGTVAFVIHYYGKDLPDHETLKNYEPAIVTRLYAGDGQLLAEYAQEKRVFTPIEVIPDLVKNAFISAEDQNYYSHDGVDFIAVIRAMRNNIMNAGGRPEGASTITQQVAKNFLLTNEVSYERKIKEAILAMRIERAMTKEQVLELYLNEIYLGAGTYGVTAAAQHYFNKQTADLEIHEAAYLAALPKAPNNYHPVRKREAAIARRNWVIGRMEIDGHITKDQEELAKLKPLEVVEEGQTRTSYTSPYFAEEVRRQIAREYNDKALYEGGLAVRTTIDPKLQDIAKKQLREGLVAYDKRHGYRGPIETWDSVDDWAKKLTEYPEPEGLIDEWDVAVVLSTDHSKAKIGFEDGTTDTIALEHLSWARKALANNKTGGDVKSVKDVLKVGDVIFAEHVEIGEGDNKEMVWGLRQVPAVNGAIIALDPHTGRVLAMEGGWKYDSSEFNRAVQAKRQPGSAFKPFVYLTALEKGFTPATLILDAPFVIDQGPGLGLWRPSNYSGEYYGPTPLRMGVEKSRNLMTVRLADYIGLPAIEETAVKFGVVDKMGHFLSNALGSNETTLLRLTNGYAQLVNGGRKLVPTFVDRVQDRNGKTIFSHDNRDCENCGGNQLMEWQEGLETPMVPDTREQLADERKVYQIVSMMEGVVQRGTAVRARALARPLGGKTGTTNDSKDTWFIGFSPDLVVGVFIGFDDPKPLGRKETGASVALPVFIGFMEKALEGKPPAPFRVPPGIRNVRINAETGARARPGDGRVIWEAFVLGTEPTDKTYILDGQGITLMNSSFGSFGDNYNDNDIVIDGNPALNRDLDLTVGTGGLY